MIQPKKTCVIQLFSDEGIWDVWQFFQAEQELPTHFDMSRWREDGRILSGSEDRPYKSANKVRLLGVR